MKTVGWIIFFVALFIILFFVLKKYLFNSIGLGSKKVSPNNTSILFIGDSLTAFNNSYADQLKAKYPNIQIKKIAKVGEKTDWMLDQLKKELNSGAKYDVIVIWGGVNDIYALNSITATKQNLQQMYDLINNNNSITVGLTVIPTKTYNKSTNKTISLTNELNSWIKSNKSLDSVIDDNSLLNNGNDGTKPEYLQNDTLHITDLGQQVIMKEFDKNVIRK